MTYNVLGVYAQIHAHLLLCACHAADWYRDVVSNNMDNNL